jgi:PAS domain S-box-containing protein
MRGDTFRLLMPAAIMLLYLAAGSLALQFVAYPENVAYFWPAAGVSAGALIVCAKRSRLYVALVVGAAVILANLGAGRSITATVIFAVSNVLEAVLCAALIWHLAGRKQLQLATIREVNILIGAALVASAATALLSMTALNLSGESAATPLELAITWAMADFAGIVAVAPVFIAFANEGWPKADPRLREGLGVLGLTGVVAYLGYHQDPGAPSWTDLAAFSAILPFLVWGAARAPRQVSAAAPALVSIIVVAQSVRGLGAFSHAQYSTDARIMATQFELVVFAMMAHYLAAIFAKYRRALAEISASRTALETRFSELEAVYAEAPLGLGMLDLNFRFVRINEALAEMNGFSANQHLGRSVWELVPTLRDAAEPLLRQVLESGAPLRNIEIHGTTPAKPGQMREWREHFYPIKSGEEIVGIGIVCEEVTETRKAQDRERLLSREVDHRAKNLLAVVNSIVQLSHAETVDAYRQAVSSRIHSLARTHSLLAGSRWEGAGLFRIVSDELAPFLHSGRIHIDGPDVQLAPAAMQDVALVIHELATNAAKYGALSSDEGRLSVKWGAQPAESGTTIRLDWAEAGGPVVTPPLRQGFGSALVEATLSGQLKGQADLDWHPDGLRATLVMRLSTATSSIEPKPNTTATASAQPARDHALRGRRVLLIEDEPLIGLHAVSCLEGVGCTVIGPVARIEPALVAAREATFDLAILDINLAGHMTFNVADVLMARGLPFAFCSGYAASSDIPDRFAHIAVLRKPISEEMLVDAVGQLETA